jgi:hypothetical protein
VSEGVCRRFSRGRERKKEQRAPPGDESDESDKNDEYDESDEHYLSRVENVPNVFQVRDFLDLRVGEKEHKMLSLLACGPHNLLQVLTPLVSVVT